MSVYEQWIGDETAHLLLLQIATCNEPEYNFGSISVDILRSALAGLVPLENSSLACM